MPCDLLSTFIPLGDPAVAAVDACATAFLTDQAGERLWGPWAGHDKTAADREPPEDAKR